MVMVMFSVVCVCQSLCSQACTHRTMDPNPNPAFTPDMFKHVQYVAFTVIKVGGWHSTEMPSGILVKLFQIQVCIPVGYILPASVATTRCQYQGFCPRSLCPGESLSGGDLCPGGFCLRRSLSRGVSI